MKAVSQIAPIAGEILFYFFFKNEKDCTGKRENGLLKKPKVLLQKFEILDAKIQLILILKNLKT